MYFDIFGTLAKHMWSLFTFYFTNPSSQVWFVPSTKSVHGFSAPHFDSQASHTYRGVWWISYFNEMKLLCILVCNLFILLVIAFFPSIFFKSWMCLKLSIKLCLYVSFNLCPNPLMQTMHFSRQEEYHSLFLVTQFLHLCFFVVGGCGTVWL